MPPAGRSDAGTDAVAAIAAVLDANVLIPAALRDTLLRAAEAELYRPLWSFHILEEVRVNLIEHRLTNADKAQQLIETMRRAFPDAQVEAYADLIPEMTNEAKDRHVLAAAVVADADVIVTHNLRDFPAAALAPYGIVVQHPDEFLVSLFDRRPALMTQVVREQAAALRRSPRTAEQLLTALTQHTPIFAMRIRAALRTTS